ncbi:MAG: DNA/RNA non-specific endonuclease [Alistipes sp.]
MDVTNTNYVYYAHATLPSNAKLRNYAFCLDRTKYAALWVAYPLHDCYIGSTRRTDAFGYDPEVSRACQANIGSGSYYTNGAQSHSRGHQLPSADRTATAEDNRTTFYATNMTPQLQTLNGGIWNDLEAKVRTWRCSDTLYVVSGCHFESGRVTYADDQSSKACAVPTHYYKVLLRTKAGATGKRVDECAASELQCIGFLFDHAAKSWTIADGERSVKQIEDLVGFTFFANVPNAPKNTFVAQDWGL